MIFKYKFGAHFDLILPKIKDKYLKHLSFIQQRSQEKLQPFTIELNDEYVFISFDMF